MPGTGQSPPPGPRRLAVWFVNGARGWGGGERWHLDMARALAARGCSVAIVADPRGLLARRAEEAGLACHRLRLRALSLLNPLALLHLVALLARERPGAVILNASHELKLVGPLARWMGVPRILFRRGIPRPPSPGPLNRWYLSRVATRLIVNSRATLAAMEGAFPVEVPRLRPLVIHNGVDPAGWEPAVPPGEGWIGAVGRLSPEKGVDRAIRALALLRRQGVAARLMVLGDGSERAALESLARELGLEEAVRFLGHRDQVAEHLRRCDLYLLPSRWEGFGYALVEAMLLELPCVAFSVGAAPEIVVHGETGLLVPDGDLEALADALSGLLRDRERARALGRAGRRRALETFGLARAVDALVQTLTD